MTEDRALKERERDRLRRSLVALLVVLLGVLPALMVAAWTLSWTRDPGRFRGRPEQVSSADLPPLDGRRWVVIEDAEWSCEHIARHRRGSHARVRVPGSVAVWATLDSDVCPPRDARVEGYLRGDFIPGEVLEAERRLSEPGTNVLVLDTGRTPAREETLRRSYGVAALASLTLGAIVWWAARRRSLLL